MLLSMTGFGEAHSQEDDVAVKVEVRTVNSRYFKCSVRASEGYAGFEPQIESVIRERIRRGTVNVNLKVDRRRHSDDYHINAEVLKGYLRQLKEIGEDAAAQQVSLTAMLALPGVIEELSNQEQADGEREWQQIESTLRAALDKLAAMRSDEGAAMAVDLRTQCETIATQLDAVAQQAPRVAENYRDRLTERLNKLLGEYDVSVEPSEVIREVGMFAERSDISEEVVRLRSHLEQFHDALNASESSGRKLEFLIQEIFREVNTIGSKANDAEIAQHVVEMKSAVERMREQVQNCE